MWPLRFFLRIDCQPFYQIALGNKFCIPIYWCHGWKDKIDNQKITDVLTVNGVRFTLEDGSWGLIRASSNKPSLVVVTESPSSDVRKKKIFEFIDGLLQKTGKIGEYDQKI